MDMPTQYPKIIDKRYNIIFSVFEHVAEKIIHAEATAIDIGNINKVNILLDIIFRFKPFTHILNL